MNILKSVSSKEGRSIELVSGGRRLPDSLVLVVGVFHGDEPQGDYLIRKYLDKKVSDLLFIPCLNPDGMSVNKRVNSNGVDLNRNFPTKNWGKNEGENATCDDANTSYYGGEAPGSEIETKFLIDIIDEYKPRLILTLHSPYCVVNYDGPARDVAERISKIIGYPAEGSIGYPTPGSFGTYCGVERNIPVITLELDEKIPVENLVQPVFEIFDYIARFSD